MLQAESAGTTRWASVRWGQRRQSTRAKSASPWSGASGRPLRPYRKAEKGRGVSGVRKLALREEPKMAQSLNRVTIIGRVGKDPEIRTLNSGDRVANLSVATSEQWKDRSSGERKEKTEWHKVTVFNDGLVGVIERYVHKGSLIYIEGSLQTRKYTDQSGAERYSTEVVLQKFRGELVLLDGKGEGGSEGRSEARQPTGGGGDGGFSADLDSEIPFATRWGIR